MFTNKSTKYRKDRQKVSSNDFLYSANQIRLSRLARIRVLAMILHSVNDLIDEVAERPLESFELRFSRFYKLISYVILSSYARFGNYGAAHSRINQKGREECAEKFRAMIPLMLQIYPVCPI